MPNRSHLSIGEVLSLLQDDFPDVTISKIRFLESQGLLDPERTPSGYRKFYEPDIERLRWILRQQRERFLPLRVIKDRLEAAGGGVPGDETDGDGTGGAAGTGDVTAPVVGGEPPDSGASGARAGAVGAPAGPTAPTAPARSAPAADETTRRGAGGGAARPVTSTERPPRSPASSGRATVGRAPDAARSSPLDAGPSGVSLTRDELAEASGLSARDLGELERYGLVHGRAVGPDTFYDDEALVVAMSSATFMRYGIEARHLRMYKVAAEREAGFFEQVVMPLVKQRNPTAKRQAAENLSELARLGEQLHAALLRTTLRDHTGLW